MTSAPVSLHSSVTGKFPKPSNAAQVTKYRKVIVYHDAISSIFLDEINKLMMYIVSKECNRVQRCQRYFLRLCLSRINFIRYRLTRVTLIDITINANKMPRLRRSATIDAQQLLYSSISIKFLMRNSLPDLDERLEQRVLARTNRGFQCSQSFKDFSKEGCSSVAQYRWDFEVRMRTYQSFQSTSLSATRVVIGKKLDRYEKFRTTWDPIDHIILRD